GDPVTAPPVEAVPAVPVPLPPLRRKFPRWVMFAATVVLLGGVMAAVFLWPRPDPPKRTIAERISAGQPLTVIGSKGRPLTDPIAIPGYDDVFPSVSADGFFTVTSLRVGMLELVAEELPLPMRLDAEIA